MIDKSEQVQRSNDLYCFAMRLTDAGARSEVVDPLIAELCQIGEVEYPPKLTEDVCQSQH